MLGDAVLYAASRATSTAFENVSRKAAWTVTAGVLFFCAFVSALIVAYQLLEPRLGAVNTVAAISAVCLLVGLFCLSLPNMIERAERRRLAAERNAVAGRNHGCRRGRGGKAGGRLFRRGAGGRRSLPLRPRSRSQTEEIKARLRSTIQPRGMPMAYSLARSDAAGPRVVVPGGAAEMAILAFLIVVTLYFGQAVLVPLSLAVILSFVLAPAVRLLRRAGLPNTPAVLIVVSVAFAIIFGIGALITQQVGNLIQEIPRYQVTLTDKAKMLKSVAYGSGAIERASETLKDIQKELAKPDGRPAPPMPVTVTPLGGGTLGRSDAAPLPVEVRSPQATALDQLQSIIGIVLAPLATMGLVILFVLFLLMRREDVRDRAIRLLGSNDLEKSTAAMDDAGDRLSSYFLALTAINAAYGIVIGTALYFIGVPSPMLWGVLAMLMRFVPFIGSVIAAICPLLLAAAVDSGWTMFLWTLALFVVSEPIMGNIIEPIVQGNRTGLSPLAIIISAACPPQS